MSIESKEVEQAIREVEQLSDQQAEHEAEIALLKLKYERLHQLIQRSAQIAGVSYQEQLDSAGPLILIAAQARANGQTLAVVNSDGSIQARYE